MKFLQNSLDFLSPCLKEIIVIEYTKDSDINKLLFEHFGPKSSQKKIKAVYVIYGIKGNTKHLIYIGKAGTVKNDGTFKNQGIDRLSNRRKGTSSQKWYQELLKSYDKLVFEILILKEDCIPSFVENLLLQRYFFEYKRLPLYNKEA
ncbi:hypothetical protein [Caminibacter sp.]